jgi:hypothetical protein
VHKTTCNRLRPEEINLNAKQPAIGCDQKEINLCAKQPAIGCDQKEINLRERKTSLVRSKRK